MVYLLDEEYELIRQQAFDGGVKMSAFVKEKLFYNEEVTKKIIEETPHIVKTKQDLNVEIKKALAKKPQNSLCPVCGSFLNQYGECNNKFRHK